MVWVLHAKPGTAQISTMVRSGHARERERGGDIDIGREASCCFRRIALERRSPSPPASSARASSSPMAPNPAMATVLRKEASCQGTGDMPPSTLMAVPVT
jgi:hypothetical protein